MEINEFMEIAREKYPLGKKIKLPENGFNRNEDRVVGYSYHNQDGHLWLENEGKVSVEKLI